MNRILFLVILILVGCEAKIHKKSDPVLTNNADQVVLDYIYYYKSRLRHEGLMIEQRGGSYKDIEDIEQKERAGNTNAVIEWIQTNRLTPELIEWIKKRNSEKTNRPIQLDK